MGSASYWLSIADEVEKRMEELAFELNTVAMGDRLYKLKQELYEGLRERRDQALRFTVRAAERTW